MKNKAADALRYMGVTRTYIGYSLVVTCCVLINDDETRLQCVKRNLYPEVAKICNCRDGNIERNIRTLINRIWEDHPDRLIEISQCELTYQPSVSEFLDYLVTYIQRGVTRKH